ncbi:PAS domain S-box protein [Sphingomonas montana]|uniref:PAS domain S-box protein n=1 Tax=Sphingomonas montana TaxID=1843236 RepID=UPI00101AE4F5|nr:PAS domain S-box protein [Sphingomonas montana]
MLRFMAGEGELAGRIRAYDWFDTDLGNPAEWPEALTTLVSVILGANQPMFVVWGPGQRLIYNDHYAAILQGHHPAALGRPFLEVWSEIADDLRPLVADAYAGIPTHTDDIMLMMERNGYPEETHFAYSYTPVRLHGGQVAGFFCACNETTSSVMADRAMRDSEARNRQILDSAIDYAILATDREGRVTRWNAGAERILGWTEAEMRGQPIDCFFTPEDRTADRPRTEMRLALETGVGNDERWHQRKSGERFWANGELTPLLNDDGSVVGFVKVLRDRTDQRLADEALRQSQAELAAANALLERNFAITSAERDRLWETSPDLLLVLDFDGIVQRVNPAWTDLLGHVPDELVGRFIADLVIPDDTERTVEALDQARSDALETLENRYRHKNGTTRWFSWVARPSERDIYAIGRDITDAKLATETLRRTEDQLRQSQKVEAIGQLTGGVAHDFNNLLTVIRGSIDLLRRPNVTDERRRRYIDAIASTADRATKLTGQLLAFARRQSLKPEIFDTGESVRAVSDMIRTLTGSRITVAVRLAPEPCYIDADRSQFDTAVVNMAVNARDAMDGEGALTITVGTTSRMPAIRTHPSITGRFVTIALTDTGSGIPADRIDQIFEPFFTTKGIGEGTGLGLSQVFGFAKQSGGDIFVESREGHGATFTLYLPQVTPDDRTLSNMAGDDAPSIGEDACVLVVEDNPDVGMFATQALLELGYQTVLAMDGQKALAELAASAERFDVVFSDVMMPGMSGIELGQEIARLYPTIPVILTSGYSEVLAQTGTHGFELVRKPYSIDELSRALRKLVRRR